MTRRYRRIEIKAFGRRLFLKAGGAVALASVLPGCDAPPSGGAGGDPQADDLAPGVPDVPVELEAGVPDVGPDLIDPAPCEDWAPDPLDGGADGEPFESAPPPTGWGDAIPPISDNASFYVTGYFGVANVDPCDWRLSISVRGEPVASLDLETIYGLDHRDREHTLQCVESRPSLMKMDNAMWTGRPLAELLTELGVTLDPAITGIRLVGADTYEVGLPIEELDVPVWLVWRMNDEPLPPEHGFPVRALCPGRYGWQNAKQLVAIDFVEGDPVPGYVSAWETHYKLQGLIAQPESFGLAPSGESLRVLGKAYAGSDPVEWIGVSVDGGETFEDAEITYAPGADRWTLWRFEWTPPEPGNYTIRCAARTASGVETDVGLENDLPFTGGMVLWIEVA